MSQIQVLRLPPGALGEVMSSRYFNNCVRYSAAALVVYDYFITFQDEVHLVWRRKITATSALFLFNRWLNVVSVLFIISTPNIHITLATCEGLESLLPAFTLLTCLTSAFFSALRVFAMWGFNKTLFCIIFLLGSIPVATNLYGFIAKGVWEFVYYPPDYSYETCTRLFDVSPEVNEAMLYLTRISVIFADFLVLLLTWIKTYGNLREARQMNCRLSVSTCILRDGTMYFFAILILNILRLLTNTASELSYMNALLQYIPSILIGRFIINLRQLADESAASSLDSPSRISDLNFRISLSRVGNIGQDLDDLHDDELHTIGREVSAANGMYDRERTVT